ncbi:MAG: hypothetical protein QOG64_1667 [Acidimicrobiaceae bacterium]|jgi:hypothetical protein|nr:hypothetical protein [Acidimicrobiaceae bacterium]
MEFLLPLVPEGEPQRGGTLAPRHRADPTLTIGLVDNGKSHANELLTEVAEALVRRGVGGSYFIWRKPSAGKPMTDEERSEMLARAHLVISGVGD